MICPDCDEKRATIRCNSTGNVYRCSECEEKKEEELGIERTFDWNGQPPFAYRDFVPYDLKHGPIDSISDSDPNKILFRGKDGARCPDLDSVHIASQAEERRYYKDMGIRNLERGEVIQGVKAELKDRPTKKIYSTPKSKKKKK